VAVKWIVHLRKPVREGEPMCNVIEGLFLIVMVFATIFVIGELGGRGEFESCLVTLGALVLIFFAGFFISIAICGG
jgi:hypothetical protein